MKSWLQVATTALLLAAVTGGVVRLTVPMLGDVLPAGAPADPAAGLAALCAAVLLLSWAWFVLCLGCCLADELRRHESGHRTRAPLAVRRLAATIAGTGTTWLLVAASSGGAHAAPHAELPLPTRHPDPPRTHVVATGESLWSISARHLGRRATDSDVLLGSHRLHALNRPRIGADPDLIHPGTRLRLPDERTA